MTDNGGYDLKPEEKPPEPPPPPAPPAQPTITWEHDPAAAPPSLKPGDPGWVPPVPIIEKADPVADESAAPTLDPDVEKFRGVAILAYIFFLIPLVAAPNSKFARFHANQGLLVFITLVSVTIFVSLLYFVHYLTGRLFANQDLLASFFGCGLSLLQFASLVGWVALVIAGIINAANGEKKELPVIGHWTLIK